MKRTEPGNGWKQMNRDAPTTECFGAEAEVYLRKSKTL
jgi:hypothetical protein